MIMMRSITILSHSYHRVTRLLKLSQKGDKPNIQTFYTHYTYDGDPKILSHAHCHKGQFCWQYSESSANSRQNGNGWGILEKGNLVSFFF
jgi:hypothetical protein